MSNFSLSYSKEKMFPIVLKDVDGELYSINSDFRVILKIFRLYDDRDVIPNQKLAMILKWFYKDKIPNDIKNAFELMNSFIKRDNTEKDNKKKSVPEFDYEFDSEEIYASFLLDYNVDLLEIEYLHWHKFQIMLFNLPNDSPFYRKLKIRFLDLKGMKGDQYSKASKAKRKIQLPIKYSIEEEIALKQVLKKLK